MNPTQPMNPFSRLVPTLLLIGLAGCQMPLAFQDPAAAREVPAWQTQGRFPGEVPAAAMQTNPAALGQYGAAQPGVQRQPYAANPQLQAQGMPVQGQPQAYPGAPQAYGQPASPTGAPLLGWDGSVTQAPQGGEIRAVSDVGTHGLQESVEGRMHIIELYQSVLDERDQLLDEVETLKVALERSQGELESQRGSATGLGARVQELEADLARLQQENQEIAARLTQAQVRRLEAEKLLLETQIAWHKDRGAAAQPPAQATGLERP